MGRDRMNIFESESDSNARTSDKEVHHQAFNSIDIAQVYFSFLFF